MKNLTMIGCTGGYPVSAGTRVPADVAQSVEQVVLAQRTHAMHGALSVSVPAPIAADFPSPASACRLERSP